MIGYFNDDQEAYMRYLGTVPREQRCKCGWALLGECFNTSCRTAFAALDARQKDGELADD